MDLTSRELASIADVFELLAAHALPEDALRLEVGRRLLDLLRADGLRSGVDGFVWSGEVQLGDVRVWRGQQREPFSERELALFDLVRPAFMAALARSRALSTTPPPPRCAPSGQSGLASLRAKWPARCAGATSP